MSGVAPAVYLVRHPPVDPAHRGVCCGRADVPIDSTLGGELAALVEQLAALRPARVESSDLRRCLAVARPLAARLSLTAGRDERLRERDFGAWELRTWQSIYDETGAAMDGLLTMDWAPPGGESNRELQSRALDWLAGIGAGPVVAVTHGGVIAALLAAACDTPVEMWHALVPPAGSVTRLGDCADPVPGSACPHSSRANSG